MARAGPRKTNRYSEQFKATAVRLSSLPEVLIQDVAESMITRRTKMLMAVVFFAAGVVTGWIYVRNAEDQEAALRACEAQCAAERKRAVLMPYSVSQVSQYGAFFGPAKCVCQ